jgi:hypothetical protein
MGRSSPSGPGCESIPARAKSEASVSSEMGLSGSKWARREAEENEFLSVLKASFAGWAKENGVSFLSSRVRGEQVLEK